MASLYIKDPEIAQRAARLAARMGTTKTQAVRDALRRLETEWDSLPAPDATGDDVLQWWRAHRRDHPIPAPTGQPADKAFFDELWGDT